MSEEELIELSHSKIGSKASKIIDKLQKENKKLKEEQFKKDELILELKCKLNNIQFEVETAWRKIERCEGE